MAIQNVNASTTGNVDFNPRRVTVQCTDTPAQVLATGYLNGANLMGVTLAPTDEVHVTCANNRLLICNVSISGNVITLYEAFGNLIPFSKTVTAALMANSSSVILVQATATQQYKIVNLFMSKGGTNFSGGGGDRLLQVTDENSTVYTVVPATNLQTLVNAGWGINTVMPYPASAGIDQATAPGTNLYARYSGGTTDYTSGSVIISGVVRRVA